RGPEGKDARPVPERESVRSRPPPCLLDAKNEGSFTCSVNPKRLQEAGGSSPPSSTVAEVEVDDTPGCGPGGSRFESGRSPHRTAGIWDERGFIRLARGLDARSRHQRP